MTKQDEWYLNKAQVEELKKLLTTDTLKSLLETLAHEVTAESAPNFRVTGNVSTIEYNALKSAEIAGAQRIISAIKDLSEFPKFTQPFKKGKPWEYIKSTN